VCERTHYDEAANKCSIQLRPKSKSPSPDAVQSLIEVIRLKNNYILPVIVATNPSKWLSTVGILVTSLEQMSPLCLVRLEGGSDTLIVRWKQRVRVCEACPQQLSPRSGETSCEQFAPGCAIPIATVLRTQAE
jgi:hypothetical protein